MLLHKFYLPGLTFFPLSVFAQQPAWSLWICSHILPLPGCLPSLGRDAPPGDQQLGADPYYSGNIFAVLDDLLSPSHLVPCFSLR